MSVASCCILLHTRHMSKAAVVPDADAIDAFATESVKVPASALKECMVLMDPELGTPLMWLDHKMRGTRNSGDVKWMAHNLETGRIEEISLFSKLQITVLSA